MTGPEHQDQKDKSSETNKVNSSDAGNTDTEDILFPTENKGGAPHGQPRILKFFWLCLLAGGIFYFGHLTQPATLENTLREIHSTWTDVKKFGEPAFHSFQSKTEEFADQFQKNQIDRVSSTSRPMKQNEGSGTNMPIKEQNGFKTLTEKNKRKVLFWRSPMDPSVTSKTPQKDSMGMNYIPVFEGEDLTQVKINPAIEQNIGVKTFVAKKQVLSREIRTVGYLTHDERLEHHIHTKYGGWIEKLYVDFTGQEVQKGDVLLEIYSPDIVATQEELVLALKYNESLKTSSFPEIRKSAARLLESAVRRLELFDIPEHQIQELIKTRTVNKSMHIHSPMRGVVLKKNAQHGMQVEPGKMLYLLANLSNIWVQAEVYEYELPYIQLGQDAEMQLSYFPGKTFKGKITFIDPMVNSKTRTVKVRLEYSNADAQLKPNMYANVRLISKPLEPEIIVPRESILQSGETSRVIIQTAKGQFKSREVITGAEANDFIQILDGIKEGERVVTSSQFLIDSESSLKEALRKTSKDGVKPIANQNSTIQQETKSSEIKPDSKTNSNFSESSKVQSHVH